VSESIGQPRAEEFDALVRELLPKVKHILPHLSPVDALRAAALMAEYRLAEEQTLVWTSAPSRR
jgi:hypothetical protein